MGARSARPPFRSDRPVADQERRWTPSVKGRRSRCRRSRSSHRRAAARQPGLAVHVADRPPGVRHGRGRVLADAATAGELNDEPDIALTASALSGMAAGDPAGPAGVPVRAEHRRRVRGPVPAASGPGHRQDRDSCAATRHGRDRRDRGPAAARGGPVPPARERAQPPGAMPFRRPVPAVPVPHRAVRQRSRSLPGPPPSPPWPQLCRLPGRPPSARVLKSPPG